MVLRPVQLIYPFSWIKLKRCVYGARKERFVLCANRRSIVCDTLESSECKQNTYDRDHINIYWMEVIRMS